MEVEINFVAVFLAALAAFFIGFVWYTIIFAKTWQKEIGLIKEGQDVSASQPPSMAKLLIGSFILEILMAFNLAYFIGDEDWQFGLFAGLATGLGFVSFAFGVNYLFEGKTLKHWVINAGYNTVIFGVMGLIIGAF